MLKYILLGFLNYGPMTGYELKSIMEESTMHFWHAYHSQIYTTLRSLEGEGLLVSEQEDDSDRRNRRVYTLTDVGRHELEAWLNRPMLELSQPKEDLLVRVFFSGSRPPDSLVDELRFQRQLHQQKLDEYLQLRGSDMRGAVPDTEAVLHRHLPLWLATLRFGIAYEQMYLEWLDETIALVEEAR